MSASSPGLQEPSLPTLDDLLAEASGTIQRRGDRVITWLVLFHCGMAMLLAPAYDTWSVAFLVAPLAAAIFFGTRVLAPGSFSVRAAAGVSLQTFCALHIFQDHGLSEQHFWFFTSTTAMIIYQDRLAMWPGVALIISQHILFAYLHNSGVELFFFEDRYVGLRKLALHFGIALVQVIVAGTVAEGLRQRTVAEARLRLAEMEATQAAHRSAEARSSFLASVSHELRTPMNGIEGMAEVLLRTELSEDQADCAETIRSSSAALVSLVNDVLDFSKSQSGDIDLATAPMEPSEVASAVLKTLRAHAEGRGVTLELSVQEPMPTLLGDSTRVRQILYNLLGNAIKFSPDGHVALRMRREPGAASDKDLVIEVTDTGVGIDPDEINSIFEPFRQAASAREIDVSGTGLGLAITARIIKTMGGTIGVESVRGEGTTVIVRLPLPQTLTSIDRVPGANRRDASVGGLGLHVLVVEDDAVNRKVASRLLTVLGCTAEMAHDGTEGVEAIRGGARYDVVLMDGHMPKLDGFGATERIRTLEKDEGRRRTPILALTASALASDHQRALDAGMDACLMKPISIERLRLALEPYRGSARDALSA